MEEWKDYEEEEPFWKGPFKIIIALFLMLILIVMSIPYYGIKENPSPSYIPTVEEVFFYEGSISNETFSLTEKDLKGFINPRDPVIKSTANKIVSLSCENPHKVCYAKALYYFVRDNFYYIGDPIDFDYVERTEDFFLSGGGDCEGGTLALANLLVSIGIESEIVLIDKHAFLRIYLPEASFLDKQKEDWVYLDWTCKNCDFGELPRGDLGKEEKYIRVS